MRVAARSGGLGALAAALVWYRITAAGREPRQAPYRWSLYAGVLGLGVLASLLLVRFRFHDGEWLQFVGLVLAAILTANLLRFLLEASVYKRPLPRPY